LSGTFSGYCRCFLKKKYQLILKSCDFVGMFVQDTAIACFIKIFNSSKLQFFVRNFCSGYCRFFFSKKDQLILKSSDFAWNLGSGY